MFGHHSGNFQKITTPSSKPAGLWRLQGANKPDIIKEGNKARSSQKGRSGYLVA